LIDSNTDDRGPLDDAIDRAVRDMTHAAADDDGVARVMARLRKVDPRATRAPWMFGPRLAWAGAAALLLVALAAVYSLRSSHPSHLAHPSSLPSQASLPSRAVLGFPTLVAAPPSTVQATTAAQLALRDTVTPASVANDAADPSDRVRAGRTARPELAPFESDLEIASITPAPLGDAPPIDVAPLGTPSLMVEAITVSSIDMPSVSPEQQR
jgi:hypothetical protein